MGWSLGYDEKWKRDIGYGVPAYCDHPGCNKEIDRGLSHVCGSEPYGGEYGCGLYFCKDHLEFYDPGDGCLVQACICCVKGKEPFTPSKEHPKWINWKLSDESWREWRYENPEETEKLAVMLNQAIEGE